jgi:hypothetical protein
MYHLHPDIMATLPPRPKIADITNSNCTKFVYNLGYFLQAASVIGYNARQGGYPQPIPPNPPNVSLFEVSLSHHFPALEHGTYDVVVVRLQNGLCPVSEWHTYFVHIWELLKPNGCIQWIHIQREYMFAPSLLDDVKIASSRSFCEIENGLIALERVTGKVDINRDIFLGALKAGLFNTLHETTRYSPQASSGYWMNFLFKDMLRTCDVLRCDPQIGWTREKAENIMREARHEIKNCGRVHLLAKINVTYGQRSIYPYWVLGKVPVLNLGGSSDQNGLYQNGFLNQNGGLNQNGVLDQNRDLHQNGDLHQNSDLNQNGDLDQNSDLNHNGDLDQNGVLNQNGDLHQNGVLDQNGDLNQQDITDEEDGSVIDDAEGMDDLEVRRGDW